jgi:[FeFe] hydrogenase H-cluster maturation GTPase HydF
VNTAPKSLRLQIGLFGRTNAGKSSLLNYIAGQDVAVTSPVPGTTTDVVEKSMEILPVGPVVFLDTGGLDDDGVLADRRLARTAAVFDRADVVVLVAEAGAWTEHEDRILGEAERRRSPALVVFNKADRGAPDPARTAALEARGLRWMACCAIEPAGRENAVRAFVEALLAALPPGALREPALVGDLLPPGGLVVLVVPIDLQAPKGRLILPQVQTIRDALDSDARALVVKERELAHALAELRRPPDLVVCDSQVVLKMTADVPRGVRCTTFSILFARYKGDLVACARGAAALGRLRSGDRVLVAEACSHHALEDDIGRVKIPRWLRQYAGAGVEVDVCAGRDYPADLAAYRAVIHCGACLLTPREVRHRFARAEEAGVPATNYGVAIAFLQGVLERVLEPFPEAAEAYRAAAGAVARSRRATPAAGCGKETIVR